VIPGFEVIRPGDPEETAAAFAAALARTDGPTLLALTRQALPNLAEIPVETRRAGTLNGAYIAVRETANLSVILIATGSELQHAVAAGKILGPGARVVSMPSMERFDRQPKSYRDSVLPPYCEKRVAIEAGVTSLWPKYVGPQGRILGIDRFGLSAPYAVVMQELGMTADAVVAAAREIGA
jgi:transketolase